MTRPKCSFCSEESQVWDPINGPICKFQNDNGFCKEHGKICPKCNKLVGRLRLIYFFGGPEVCDSCRDKEWDDIFE